MAFHPPVIAHRGAGCSAPENTLAAIRLAHEQGAKWIEVDVKITYDGVPILIHDETLERTTDGSGLVAEQTWEEIQKLHAASSLGPEPVPTLVEAVNLVLELDMSLVVELKPCPGRARATTMVAMIELAKVWPERDLLPVICSFDMECLEMAMQLEPHWPRAYAIRQWQENWRASVEQAGASALSVKEDQLTASRVEEVVGAQLPLLAYTVNQPARAKELLDMGVTAVYADCPKLILDQLK
ncbi:MAG: glycerophosphodiester phosphodiesterase family protein [Alphaproteobacteria bacterium]|nr:glycerophosphodiester phosphodiesterase family protein [Alphaproteobacteria bacterium]